MMLAGAEERSSGPRRAYLYGVALVSALFVLFYLTQVVYRIFLWVLGDPMADILSLQTAADIARSGIAATVWVYHVMAIRKDGRMTPPVTQPAMTAQTWSPDETRQALVEKIARLEQELAVAKAALQELD